MVTSGAAPIERRPRRARRDLPVPVVSWRYARSITKPRLTGVGLMGTNTGESENLSSLLETQNPA